LVQSGEGQLHLGLNAGCAQYPATVRVVDDVLQHRHLSHTGLTRSTTVSLWTERTAATRSSSARFRASADQPKGAHGRTPAHFR
jgi:hypothetical protein